MTSALYTLRIFQLGIHMADLEYLDYGDVMDIITEAGNDQYKYRPVATQEDFDRF